MLATHLRASPAAAVLRRRTPQAARPSRPRVAVTVRAAAFEGTAEVPDMGKRNAMNLLLLGGVALPAGFLAVPYALFFVPISAGGSAGGAAKDALGNDVNAAAWLKAHGKNDRTLVQGLKGDPTYLVVSNEGGLDGYGVNAICTHLGCVVPWVGPENKFKCPCHGSQYNSEGKVIRGPAPLSLALAHVTTAENGTVMMSPWTETDFRDGSEPWWKP